MRLLKILLNALAFSGLIDNINAQRCGRTMLRKEIREMTPREIKSFFSALTKLYNNKPIKGSKLHKLDYFGWAHTQVYKDIHQNPAFFPWHRYFLQLFQLMILQVDPTVVIPYWDWSKDSQEPHKSPIFTDELYGGNGNKNQKYQVQNGFMKNWEMHFPNTHIMQRCFHKTNQSGSLIPSNELDPFPSSVLMNSVINQYKTFSEMAWNAELFHGYAHILIGGDEGELGPSWSPNDLIFYLHHAYMDRVWWLWQKRNPDLAKSYDGKFYDRPINVNVNDILKVPGAPSIPVNATFDTLSWPFCYTYTEPEDSKVMLNSDDNPKAIVKDTDITKSNVSFDKIDNIIDIAKAIKENPGEVQVSDQLKDALKMGKPKIKRLNPMAPLKMMMISNPQRIIDKINDVNKKVEAISSLKGFEESAVNR